MKAKDITNIIGIGLFIIFLSIAYISEATYLFIHTTNRGYQDFAAFNIGLILIILSSLAINNIDRNNNKQ